MSSASFLLGRALLLWGLIICSAAEYQSQTCKVSLGDSAMNQRENLEPAVPLILTLHHVLFSKRASQADLHFCDITFLGSCRNFAELVASLFERRIGEHAATCNKTVCTSLSARGEGLVRLDAAVHLNIHI